MPGRRLLAGWLLFVSFNLLASAPVVTTQPQSRTVVEGTNHTFSAAVSGTEPLFYQWRKDGNDLANKTNSSLGLTGILTNDAGFYSVVVTNTEGATTSTLARLTVRLTNDPAYPAPQGGWSYLLGGDAAGGDLGTALDGTWNHQNDQWAGDGRGAGDGTLGGVSTTNGLLTIEDAVSLTSGTFNNRRIYLTRDLSQDATVTNASTLLNDGVTLTFRARLTPANDPLVEITNAPNGHVNNTDGKGMFGLRQSGSSGMIVSFSLGQAVEDTNATGNFTFAGAGLHMNNLNGNTRSASVDPGEGGTTNLLVVDPAAFHEFWITIQDNGGDPGTHRVSIYRDGSQTATVFNVTAGLGSDGPAANYLALGMGNSAQRGAMDVDFFGYRAGVSPPPAFNEPVGIVFQPTNQFVATGQVASFSVGVTGTPPYSIQWFRDGAAISGATNLFHATGPVATNDDGAQFVVVVGNEFNSVTSSPPAVLQLLGAPVITAQPQSLTVTNGDPASLSVTATSGITPAYQWRLNGNNLSNATNATFFLASASSANAGAYDVIVANSGGSTTSTVATLTVVLFDFGDAPDPGYPTLKAGEGARHVIVAGLRLGAAIDAEVNGLPDSSATGDDLNASSDEDGVNFLTSLRVGRTTTVEVVASTNGVLNAWIDFDRNGAWAGAGEQVFTNLAVIAGTNSLQVAVPLSASLGGSFARFRFNSTGGLSFNEAASDGEVEDYAVIISPVADLMIALTDAPDPIAAGSNLTYSISISNAGPSTAASVAMTDSLPAGVNFVSATPSQGSCGHSLGVVNCPIGSLASGASAIITVVATPSMGASVTNTAVVSAAEFDPNVANNSATTATTVLDPPAITAQPQSRTVTNGNNVAFSATATGTAPLQYEWRFNGAPIGGGTNTSLTISNAQVSNGGDYTVRIMNQVGAVESQVATLTVLVPPAVTAEPQSRTNLARSLATFSVTATGTAPLAYQWRLNSTNIPGETNSSLAIPSVQLSNAGPYQVVISNAAGTATSVAAILTVIAMDFGDAPDGYPSLLAVNGARHRVAPGVRLGAIVDFEADATTDTSATGDDLETGDDEDGVAFASALRVGQVIGVSVIASTNGQLNGWVDFNRDGSWSQAGEQVFTNRVLSTGTNSLTLTVPAGASVGASFARFRFDTAGGLSFDGEAANGEVEDYSVTIEAVADLSVAKFDQIDPIAAGSNQVYSIIVSNAGPSAASGVALSDTLPPGVTYIAAVASQGACTQSAGVVACPLGDLAAGGTATVSLTIVPNAEGFITNTVLVGGSQTDLNAANNSASVISTVQVFPEILVQPESQTMTNGGAVTFSVSASGTALRYQWRLEGVNLANATNASLNLSNVQPSNAGNYTVRITNLVGSVLGGPATLTVLGPAVITTQPQSQTVIVGATVTLSVVASGSPPFSYQWEFDGSDLSGETGASLVLANIQPSQAGNYRVRVTNPVNTATSSVATITVQQPPVFTLHPQSQTNLAGTATTLTALATGTAPLRYQWYFNTTNALANQTNTSLVLSNLQASQSGNYFVAASNIAASTTSSVAVVTVFEVDFGDAPESLGYPVTMTFNGARHRILPGVRLGSFIDFETNGLPNLTATGDDLAGTDDEDGVTFTSPFLVGQLVPVTIVASTNGFLDAWFDFNANGTWADSEDQVLAGYAVAAGTNTVPVPISPSALVTNTFARFRFSTTGGLNYDGFASSGEVEDYAVTIQPSADLGITILDVPDPVFVLSNLIYTIVVTNRGPSGVTGLFVTNDLPSSVTYLSAVASQGTCSHANGRVVCSLGSMAVDAGAMITVTTRPGSAGTIVATALIRANQGESVPADNFVSQSTTVMTPAAGFTNLGAITVADATASAPGAGNPYPSTILVSGLTGAVAKVTVTLNSVSHSFASDLDILLVSPGGQTVLLMSDAGGGFVMSGLTLTFDDAATLSLPSGGVISSTSYRPTSFEPGSDAFPSPAPGAPFGTTLSVLNGYNPNGAWSLYVIDDFESDTGIISGGWRLNISTADAIADVAVGVTDVPDPVGVFSNLVYSVAVTNRGPANASNVQLTNQLPAGVAFISATATQGSCTNQGGIVRCEVGGLLSGAGAVATITVSPTATGSMTNTASAGGAQLDLVASNNLARTSTSVRQVTDLVLSHATSTNTVVLGQDFAYSLLVSNRGPAAATTVRLTDILPLNIDVVAVGSSQGACTNNAGTLSCDLTTIAPGAQVQVNVIVHPTAVGSLTNSVSLAMDQIDSAATNNASSIVTAVVVVADVAISLSASPNPVAVSNNVTYAISVTNLGPSTASGVTVTNRIPANVSFVSANAAQGSCTNENGVVRCDLGPMIAGSGVAVAVVLKPGVAGMLTNSAGVASGSLDTISSNNIAASITSVEVPPFITVEPQAQTVTNGVNVTFSVTASGTAPIRYQWQFNGGDIGGATNSNLILTNVQLAAAGNYRVRLTNAVGSALSTIATLNVWVPPTISDIADLPTDEDTATPVISFTIGDADSAAAELVVAASSSNTLLVPTNGISFGGGGALRTLEILPATNRSGTATITVQVRDPNGLTAVDSFVLTVHPVNDAPIFAGIGDQTTLEDASLVVPISVSDVETASSNLLVAVASSNPALIASNNVVVSLGTNQSLTLHPLTNENGVATITVSVTDTNGASATNFFLLTVVAVNDPPTLTSLTNRALIEDAGLQTVVLSGISGGPANESQVLAFTASSSDTNIIAAVSVAHTNLQPTGLLTFVPVANASGMATLSVRVDDGGGSNNLVTRTFDVQVDEVNDPPTLSTIANLEILEDTASGPIPFTIGDAETAASNLVVTAFSSDTNLLPQTGILRSVLGTNGSVHLLPATNASGPVTVTVVVTDGTGGATSNSFVVTVIPVNDAPTLADVQDQATLEDIPVTVSVAINDVETAAGNLSLSVSSSNSNLLSQLGVSLGGNGSDRLVTLTPVTNESGSATITLTINDGTNSVIDTFVLSVSAVNDLPTLDPISPVTVAEDSGSRAVSLTGMGIGATNELQALLFTVESSNPAIVPTPVIQYTNGLTTGVLEFAPALNATGSVNITVTLNDGGTSNNLITRVFPILVTPINDLPEIGSIDGQTTVEDVPLLVNFTVADVDSSLDGLAFTVSAVNTNLLAGLAITGVGADRVLAIAPAPDEFGSSLIHITVIDGHGGTNTQSFPLAIAPVNDVPTLAALADLELMVGAGAQSVLLSNITSGAANELQALAVTAVSGNPGVVATTSVDYTNGSSMGVLQFSLVPSAIGTSTITVTVDDGAPSNHLAVQSFTVVVSALNEPPTISDIGEQTILEDASLDVAFNIGDAETALTNLLLSITSSNTNLLSSTNVTFEGSGAARSLHLLPSTNQSGSATVTVTVSDGQGRSASDSFVLTVLPVDDPPTLSAIGDQVIDEDGVLGPISILVGSLEFDPATLGLSGTSSSTSLAGPASFEFSGSGSNRTMWIRPVTNQFGTATVTITVTDTNGLPAARSFLLTVKPVNDPPTLAQPVAAIIDEDAGPQAIPLIGIGSGASNEIEVLTITVASDTPSLLPVPTVSYLNPASTGTLQFTPAANASGSALLTVTVNDGKGSNNTVVRSFVVTVNPANDPPSISSIANQSTDEDTLHIINFTVADDTTPAAELQVTASSSNTNLVPAGGLSVSGIGSSRTLSIAPATNTSGSATITVSATDTNIATGSRSFVLTVNSVNDAPAISDIANLTVAEDTNEVTLSFIIGDSETPVAALSVTGVSSNPGLIPSGSIVMGGSESNRTVTMTPLADQSGTATITVTVRDAGGRVASDGFVVTVAPVNDPPTIAGLIDVAFDEDTTMTMAFALSDKDNAIGSLSVTGSSSDTNVIPAAGISVIGTNLSRVVAVTPAPNQSGSATITLIVSDGSAAATNTFQAVVNLVNDAPSISDITNRTTTVGTAAGPIPFLIGDAESEAGTLNLSATSSNPSLVDPAGITFGGSISNRTLTVAPVAGRSGTTLITVFVDDGGATNSDAFVLTVGGGGGSTSIVSTFGNLATVTLVDGTAASPYPSTINVSGVNGTITEILVTVSNLTHTFPDDIDLLLAGPGGQRAMLMSDVGGGTAVTNRTLIFSDAGAAPVPDTGPLVSGTFRPTDVGPGDTMPAPAPAGPYGTNLSVFNGLAANGTWSLYGVDDGGGDAGAIQGGWSLRITTQSSGSASLPPTISDISNQTTNEDSALLLSFTVNDADTPVFQLSLAATSTNTALIANTNIFFDGSGTDRLIRLVPSPNQSGTTLITVTVGDGSTNATDSFLVTLAAVNDPPTLNALADVPVSGNNPPATTVPLAGISSGATNEAQTLTITTISSNPGVVPTPSVSYTSPNATGSISFDPPNGAVGSSIITVEVRDGGASNNLFSRSFVVSVRSSGNTPPTITTIGNQTIPEDGTTGLLAFTVGDSVTPAGSLAVVAKSSDTNLVPTNSIVLGGSGGGRTITVTPAANQSGTSAITVSVTDADSGLTTNIFLVSVNAVNDLPLVSTIADQSIEENTSTPVIPFAVSDVETPAANLSITATSTNTALVPNANIVLGGSGTNRALVVTPVANQNGRTLITLSVGDGTATTNRSFLVTVTGTNDTPVISAIGDQNINEDGIVGPINFTIGDGETPADALSLTASSSNADLIPAGNISLGGSGVSRNVTVTPLANASGLSTVTLTVSDGTNASSSSFVVTIVPVNDVPTLGGLSDLSLNQGAGEQVVSLTGISPGATNENQHLVLTATSGNLALLPALTIDYASGSSNGTLRFTPAASASGTVLVSVTVNDGQLQNNTVTRSFNVTVRGAPSISDITDLTIDEDVGTNVVSFTVSDLETPAASLVIAVTSSDTNLVANTNIVIVGTDTNRTVTVRPTTNQFGHATITITVTDGDGLSASDTFEVMVHAINDSPTLDPVSGVILAEDAGLQSVMLSGIGPGADNEVQDLEVTARSGNPALVPDPVVAYTSPGMGGTLSFTPAANATGSAVIAVIVSDGQSMHGSVTQTFNVTVVATNDAPTISLPQDLATPEDTPVVVGFSIADAETASGSLSVAATSSNPALVVDADIIAGGSDGNRALLIAPLPNQHGLTTITVTVSDGAGGSAVRGFVLTVNPVNDLPVISDLEDQSVDQDTSTPPLPFTVSDVETSAGQLNLVLSSSNAALVPTNGYGITGTGNNRSLVVTPAAGQSGHALLTLTATDTNGGVGARSFHLLVRRTAQPPGITAQPQSQTVTNGATVVFSVAAGGAGPFAYQWRRNAVDLGGQTEATLTLTGVQSTDEGSYTVRVSNSTGTVMSAPAVLRVLTSPMIASISRTGNLVDITFNSELGNTYRVEFTDTLAAPVWNALPTVAGTGGVLTVSDPSATLATRFYRLRVE